MPFCDLPSTGCKLHYQLHGLVGEGRPKERVALVAGFACYHSHWQPQTDVVPSGWQMLAYDHRGVGRSESPGGRWTTACLAQDLLELLNHLRWEENVHLVGKSLGGMVCQEAVLLRPDIFGSLTLISAPTAPWPCLGGLMRLSGIATSSTFEEKVEAVLRFNFPDVYLYDQGRQTSAYEQMSEAVVRHARGNPPISAGTLRKQAGAVATHKVGKARAARLLAADIPVLFIYGELDALFSCKGYQRTLSVLQPQRVLALSNAAHGVHEQCAQEVNAAIASHIAEVSERRCAGPESSSQMLPEQTAPTTSGVKTLSGHDACSDTGVVAKKMLSNPKK